MWDVDGAGFCKDVGSAVSDFPLFGQPESHFFFLHQTLSRSSLKSKFGQHGSLSRSPSSPPGATEPAVEEVKLKIKDLNEHIVCYLCAGYFIDATTITECLHTFCKSCIVKYLQTSKYCPMCNIKIHETQPLLNLKLDRVMQDIVYKLVPGLQESEDKRIKEFYQSRGLERVIQPAGDDAVPDATGLPYTSFDHSKAHFYRYDEQVSLCLERLSSSLAGKDKTKLTLQQKFVRCSVRAEVRHLRKVLCHRLNVEKHQVQMLFNNESLPDHMTMKRLWLSHWFGKAQPLVLHYTIKDKRTR
uniref:Polycomb group RING finger protein 1 n=1 Tax=Dicentrarchus labrax TaxID=13489 RepID=A0A8P4GIU6_DICLA